MKLLIPESVQEIIFLAYRCQVGFQKNLLPVLARPCLLVLCHLLLDSFGMLIHTSPFADGADFTFEVF
eukprot:200382-Rhodomonas_salina.2